MSLKKIDPGMYLFFNLSGYTPKCRTIFILSGCYLPSWTVKTGSNFFTIRPKYQNHFIANFYGGPDFVPLRAGKNGRLNK